MNPTYDSYQNDLKEEVVITPFLKWAWSKRQMLSKLEGYLPETFNNYYEPFVWGGSMYFSLKGKGIINNDAYLSDYNDELINTYTTLKDNPSKLVQRMEILKKKHSKEFFYEVRARDRKPGFKNRESCNRAARFIYLNKTCFNGIWRTNLKWQNNVPFGNHMAPRLYNLDNIESCSKVLNDKTYIQSGDFKAILKTAKKWDFIFLDPPYDPINATSNFTSYNGFSFSRNMQEEVFNMFEELSERWCFVMLTNNSTDYIMETYSKYISKFWKILVSARGKINCKWELRKKVREIIIKNYI